MAVNAAGKSRLPPGARRVLRAPLCAALLLDRVRAQPVMYNRSEATSDTANTPSVSAAVTPTSSTASSHCPSPNATSARPGHASGE